MSENREGYVYEVATKENSQFPTFKVGSIIVMYRDDGTSSPYFTLLKGERDRHHTYGDVVNMECLKQLWPIPDEPVETIELMGKTYAKKDIESALSSVKEI